MAIQPGAALPKASPWRAAGTLARLSLLALRFWRGWKADETAFPPGHPKRDAALKARGAALASALAALGPTFVKLGQALATRPDLLPLPMIDGLSDLHDRVPPFPWAQAKAIVEAELKRPIALAFSAFDPTPVAAASLGQVHRAKLLNGVEVAVKVQRPRLLESFANDLQALRWLIAWGEKRWPELLDWRLGQVLDAHEVKLLEEADYRVEAQHARRFAKAFAGHPRVSVPAIHEAWSSRRVLTMQFMHGDQVTRMAYLEKHRIDRRALVAEAVAVQLDQLLIHGFFHADLHPGNVWADPEGRLIYLDFGLMGEFPAGPRERVVLSFVHLIVGDLEALEKDLELLGFIPPGRKVGKLKPILAQVAAATRGHLQAGRPSFKALTDPLAEAFFAERLRVPVDFAFVMRTLVGLEGLGLRLDPSFHPFDVALPYVARHVLSPAGQGLREAVLPELFGPDGPHWEKLFALLEAADGDPAFRIQDVARWGLEWFFSHEGKPWRERIVATVLGEGPLPWSQLERLLEMAAKDPSFDLAELARPLAGHLLRPEGLPIAQRVASKMAQDALSGRLGEWVQGVKLVRLALGELLPF